MSRGSSLGVCFTPVSIQGGESGHLVRRLLSRAVLCIEMVYSKGCLSFDRVLGTLLEDAIIHTLRNQFSRLSFIHLPMS